MKKREFELVLNYQQRQCIMDMMVEFYSDPANQAAFEKWKAERDAEKAKGRRRKKSGQKEAANNGG